MVSRMQNNGIAIDIPYFHDLSAKLQRLMDEEYATIRSVIPLEALQSFITETVVDEPETEPTPGNEGEPVKEEPDASVININSPEQLADLLFTHMGLGSEAKLKTTKNGKRISTGKKSLEMIKDEHPIIRSILKYREYAKLKNTYCDKMPLIARWDERTQTYRVHSQFPLTRTETGRLASRNPNLMNIPARSKLGAELRMGFIAAPGKVLLSRDFSQIELRVLAHLADEARMIQIFHAGGDIHDMTTMAMYHLTIEQWNALEKSERKKMRTPVKNLQFGLAYGLSALGLQQGLLINDPPIDWTEQQCQEFIDYWYSLYTSVRPYMDSIHAQAYQYGLVWCMFGRVRLMPGVRSVHNNVQSAAMREAGNMPIQASAQGLIKLAMARCEDETNGVFRSFGMYVEPLIQVHDEIIWECDEDYVDCVSDYFNEVMCSVVKLKVPIQSAGSWGKRWEK